MKKLIIFFTSMVLAVAVAHANPVLNKNGGDDCTYCCPKCKKCAAKEGECAKDKCTMVKNGTYYCEKDKNTSEVAAKCPQCNKDMKKVECKK